jgi:hypothetical protein
MNRRSILNISAMTALGFALLPSSIVAQQGTLKQQLVGNWTLVSFDITAPNGTKRQVYGANPRGILMLDAGGRYAVVAGKPDRPKFKSPGRATETTEELGAAARDFAANFGTWSVNEADKTLTRRLEGALRPDGEGTEQKTTVSLAGDQLTLTNTNPATGNRADVVYRRAR